MRRSLCSLIIVLVLACSCADRRAATTARRAGAYPDEARARLGRGLISYVKGKEQVLLGWRLLPGDPKGVSFDVYRKGIGEANEKYKRIGRTDRTSFSDRVAAARRYVYAVRPSFQGNTGELSRESMALSSVGGKAAMVFELGQRGGQARMITGDLDGDGEREIVIAYSGYRNVDPYEKAWSKSGDTIKVAAFRASGDRLWTVDMGWGIEAGAVYHPIVVWDLDADGRAEVILKTNRSADPRDYSGERVTILDGLSGRIRAEAPWPSLRDLGSDYNNDSRNYLAIAHLDGQDPFLIAIRGLYKTQRMIAYDKSLRPVWKRTLGLDHYYPSRLRDRLVKFWNIDDKKSYLLGRLVTGKRVKDQFRGSHYVQVADLDDDGKEEILWGERCIGDNGKDLWTVDERFPYRGHPDIVFPADMLPSNPGQEVFFGREGWGEKGDKIGMYVTDSGGRILWAKWGYNHVDTGWVGKIVPGEIGPQLMAVEIEDKEWTKEGAELKEPRPFLWSGEGKLIGNPPGSWYYSFPVDWDGDGVREIALQESGEIRRYRGPVVEKIAGASWGADLFGDHREEVVAATGDGRAYIFFNMEASHGPPRVTPLADRRYRNDLSRTAMQGTPVITEGGTMAEMGTPPVRRPPPSD